MNNINFNYLIKMILLKKLKLIKSFTSSTNSLNDYKFMVLKSAPRNWNEQIISNFFGGFTSVDFIKKFNSPTINTQTSNDFIVKFKEDTDIPINFINKIALEGGDNINIKLTKEIILDTPVNSTLNNAVLVICDKNGMNLKDNSTLQNILPKYEEMQSVSIQFNNQKSSVANLWIKSINDYEKIIKLLKQDNSLYICQAKQYSIRNKESSPLHSFEAHKFKIIKNRLSILSLLKNNNINNTEITELINEEKTIQSINKEKENIANYKNFIAFANTGVLIHDK